MTDEFAKETGWDKVKGFRRFTLPGRTGSSKNVIIEVNWNSDKDVQGCRSLRIKSEDGSFESVVKYEDLMSLMFLMGDREAQRAMIIPIIKKQKQRQFIVTQTATKDYQKGQPIVFNLWINLEEEQVGERNPYPNFQDPKKFTK